MIKRFLLLLFFIQSTLFSCALCTIYSPQTKVMLDVNTSKDKITTIDVTWVLNKEFTEQLKQIYDTNLDGKIKDDELEFIYQAMVDYANLKDYMLHISYAKTINKEKSNKINIIKKSVKIKNGILHFFYTAKLDYELKDDYALYIKIEDDEEYFILNLQKDFAKFKSDTKTEKIFTKNSVIFYINHVKKIEKKEVKEEKIELTQDKKIKEQTILSKFVEKVKTYLVAVKNKDNFALITLLFVSFIYGMLHALGPGHGKALAFTYFSSNKSSYIKAFIISQASAFIHIIGAFILVVISVFIIKSVLNNFVKDSVEILTIISALMIMALALYILYQKLSHKSCNCCAHTPKQAISWSNNKQNFLKANGKIDLKKASKKRSDLYFVLTAGLIPCPGTVILFIYAFILKTYFAVLLASIFISLGMGLVIFASSFLGVSLHKISQKSQKYTRILELASPIVMFILGVLLLLSASL